MQYMNTVNIFEGLILPGTTLEYGVTEMNFKILIFRELPESMGQTGISTLKYTLVAFLTIPIQLIVLFSLFICSLLLSSLPQPFFSKIVLKLGRVVNKCPTFSNCSEYSVYKVVKPLGEDINLQVLFSRKSSIQLVNHALGNVRRKCIVISYLFQYELQEGFAICTWKNF